MAGKKRVLVTGISGLIGTIIKERLGHLYELTGISRRPVEGVRHFRADVADFEAIRPAFEGQDVVVHLAADPSPTAPWESVLRSNIIGTYNVFEASRQAGVKRVVFASTNHTVGYYPLKQDPYKAIYDGRLGEVRRPFPLIGIEAVRPDGYYGVSKVFGEALGSYYHDAFGISVINLRIGWVMKSDDPTTSPPALSLWLSHRDCAQVIQKAIDAPPSVGFATLYAMSDNKLLIWDLEPTKRVLGYEPEDGAGEEWHEVPGAPRFM